MFVGAGLEGGSMDFRAVVDGVPALVELPDEADGPRCLVGDLLGDFKMVSIDSKKPYSHAKGSILLVLIPRLVSLKAWGSQH